MRDLNFFESYVEKRSLKLSITKVLFAFIILYALYTIALGLFNLNSIKSLEKNVADLRAITENPSTIEKVNEIKELETQVLTFEEEVNKIKVMDKVVEDTDIIDEEYLNSITAKMPEDLFFTNLSINKQEIQISGISKDKWSVAEFGKGLEDIENVDEIFVSHITSEEDYYRFSMIITLKEVGINDDTIV